MFGVHLFCAMYKLRTLFVYWCAKVARVKCVTEACIKDYYLSHYGGYGTKFMHGEEARCAFGVSIFVDVRGKTVSQNTM